MTAHRSVLLVVHTGRDEATETARRVEKVLGDNKIALRVLSAEAVDRGSLHLAPDDMRAMGVEIEVVDADQHATDGCELVLVLGGDGTFCGQPSWPATPAFRCWASIWAASAFWPRPRRRQSTRCSSMLSHRITGWKTA